MKREELINKAKELGIKGISRMKKVDLEWAIYLKASILWFNDITENNIIIHEDIEVELEVLDVSNI
jgi:predicted nucleotidyltransferase